MILIENHIGTITISKEYLTTLVGHTVTGCFGVAGMNTASLWEGVRSAVQSDKELSKGVGIMAFENRLTIDLHISVSFGTNISAIVDSISNKVRFAVFEATGIEVAKVNVFIDGIHA